MLGILFLYFIGKYFYELAHEYNKNKWLFAILGIVMYYLCTAILGIVIGVSDELWGTKILDGTSDVMLGIIAMPFGFLGCWGFYKILKNRWSKKAVLTDNEVLDDQFIN